MYVHIAFTKSKLKQLFFSELSSETKFVHEKEHKTTLKNSFQKLIFEICVRKYFQIDPKVFSSSSVSVCIFFPSGTDRIRPENSLLEVMDAHIKPFWPTWVSANLLP